MFSPQRPWQLSHTGSLSQHSYRSFILGMLQNVHCLQVSQGCADVWQEEHLMINMQRLTAHTAPRGKGRVHSSGLYCWQVEVCHSSTPSTSIEESPPRRTLSVVGLTAGGKATINNLSFVVVTCPYAVRNQEPPLWVLSARLGELKVSDVLYELVWINRCGLVCSSDTEVCRFSNTRRSVSL